MKLGPLQPATLTHRNHFEFGYNGVPFSERNSADDEWFVRYGACERMPHSFYEECLKTARLIRESTTLPIDVLFSGGVDSEVALRAFLDAGIEVRVLSLRFARGLNAHDIEWVERVCSGLGVKARYVDLDLERFWETDAYDYAARTQCVSPQLVSTMWLADQTDGYCVLGSGENFIVKRLEESYIPGESPYLRSIWDLFEKEKIASWYRHFLLQNRDAAPGFFQFTPEIMLSWFLDEMGCDLWNDRIEGNRNSVSSKLPF
ncbi:MAG: 7-cyano-7-deazaguanine synthase, partial [Bdellovibrionales bacterium]|nr:7-cyano-7-deazaguanine synthase [Bdellovibrionales bacterium]